MEEERNENLAVREMGDPTVPLVFEYFAPLLTLVEAPRSWLLVPRTKMRRSNARLDSLLLILRGEVNP